MGVDVYINGELTIPADKVMEAGTLLLKALVEKKVDLHEHDDPDDPDTFETPKKVASLIEAHLGRFKVELDDVGNIIFYQHDSVRHEDEDWWIFEALAPVIGDGEFYMQGDDSRWRWVVENGALSEDFGETLYGQDVEAVTLAQKIIDIVYPPHLGGRPVTAVYDVADGEYEAIVEKIENTIRESGFGPQAGKTELDRLAEV